MAKVFWLTQVNTLQTQLKYTNTRSFSKLVLMRSLRQVVRSMHRAGVALAVALIGWGAAAAAGEDVKLTPAQAQNLGVRVAHPVSSTTDQTLP